MRFAFIGDIVGKNGVALVIDLLPRLRRDYRLDVIVANAENAYNGSGLSPGQYRSLIQAGVDLITLGDHAYKRQEIFPTLESKDNIIRPANFPDTGPGRGWTTLTLPDGRHFSVLSLLGRVFMRPVDCPFVLAERILDGGHLPPGPILVDFHAEATSDKILMGFLLDGRVSAVIGTHTHVTTADHRILPGGTAFQCDVGMSGPHNGVIGRDAARVLRTVMTFQPTTFIVADGDLQLHATIVETDEHSHLATAIQPIVLYPLEPAPAVAQPGLTELLDEP